MLQPLPYFLSSTRALSELHAGHSGTAYITMTLTSPVISFGFNTAPRTNFSLSCLPPMAEGCLTVNFSPTLNWGGLLLAF
ncbi:unnamed protein product [Schistosoma curassoni]|uniref:Secreted protein n=1 Tax=Schistosoma curassoni TaxID=6186 RepID=A0A183KV93_9TREM|nr:unnamed protein product [Schistosoma curassoni]